MDNTGKTILAFLAGLTAGAIGGLLLAPESGEETRKRLNDSADNLIKDLEKSWEDNSKKVLADHAMDEVERYGKELANSTKK